MVQFRRFSLSVVSVPVDVKKTYLSEPVQRESPWFCSLLVCCIVEPLLNCHLLLVEKAKECDSLDAFWDTMYVACIEESW